MMNDAVLPPVETKQTNLQVSKKPSPKKETPVIALPVEKKIPVPPPKDFPIDKWTMPPEQQGYIHGNDNDCL